ncbi:hypothetical protein J6590_054933 [Homalodisca vitripennis]|nr:hypothetical protein J6590_054933 [Homalodisca vitripennis]
MVERRGSRRRDTRGVAIDLRPQRNTRESVRHGRRTEGEEPKSAVEEVMEVEVARLRRRRYRRVSREAEVQTIPEVEKRVGGSEEGGKLKRLTFYARDCLEKVRSKYAIIGFSIKYINEVVLNSRSV